MLSCIPLCTRQDLDRLMRGGEESSPIPTEYFRIDDWTRTILHDYLAEQEDGKRLLKLLEETSRSRVLQGIEEARIVVGEDDDPDALLFFSVNEGIRVINRIIMTHTVSRLA